MCAKPVCCRKKALQSLESFDAYRSVGCLCHKSLKYFSGTQFNEVFCSVGKHVPDCLCPEDRSSKLCQEVRLDFFRVGGWTGCDILIYRAYRSAEDGLFNALCEFFPCWFHKRGVEGSADRKHEGSLRSGFLQSDACFFYGSGVS